MGIVNAIALHAERVAAGRLKTRHLTKTCRRHGVTCFVIRPSGCAVCCICLRVTNLERISRPEEKAKQKAHVARPEIRERLRLRGREYNRERYRNREDVRVHQAEYRSRPEVREHSREYRRSWEKNPARMQYHAAKEQTRNALKRGAAYVAAFDEPTILGAIRSVGACAYCLRQIEPKGLTADHVVALARGGPHSPQNLVPACQSCNSKKGTRPGTPLFYPLTARPSASDVA